MANGEEAKQIVRSFNKLCIEEGNLEMFDQLLASDFLNRTAPVGAPSGPESMKQFLGHALRAGFSDLKVEIHDQIAEGDKVTTRKTITGNHTGTFMGIAPTGKADEIQVIDIVRVENGKYKEHWGVNTLASVLNELKAHGS